MYIINILIFIIVFDGIKILFESFCKYEKGGGEIDKNLCTVLIPAYNAEKFIMNTINSAYDSGFKEILVIINNTTDNTERILKENKIKYKNIGKGNKSLAQKAGLKLINTPYILLLDADTIIPTQFTLPKMNKDVGAICFCVLPTPKKGLLNILQSYEYEKSMNIGRKFLGTINSVSCVSGAIGLFKTEVLTQSLKEHSNTFQGEDLELTLRTLLNGNNISYSNQIIYTDAPKSILKLFKQRMFGWGFGGYRNIPLMIKLLFKKDIRKRLKYDLSYNIISLILDPFKVLLTICYLDIKYIIIMYLIYVTIEIFISCRIRNRKVHVILLYPIYNVFNMIMRFISLIYFVSLKVFRIKKTK